MHPFHEGLLISPFPQSNSANSQTSGHHWWRSILLPAMREVVGGVMVTVLPQCSACLYEAFAWALFLMGQYVFIKKKRQKQHVPVCFYNVSYRECWVKGDCWPLIYCPCTFASICRSVEINSCFHAPTHFYLIANITFWPKGESGTIFERSRFMFTLLMQVSQKNHDCWPWKCTGLTRLTTVGRWKPRYSKCSFRF